MYILIEKEITGVIAWGVSENQSQETLLCRKYQEPGLPMARRQLKPPMQVDCLSELLYVLYHTSYTIKCSGEWSCRTPHTMSKLRRAYHSRMIVWSSSSEDSDGDHPHPQGREIIELSDSSSQWSPKRGSKKNATRPIPAGPKTLAFCSDEEDSCGDDGAVLTL